MEENGQNNEPQENNIKQEAVNTFNKTKEEIKNMNFKEEVQKGKGLITKLFLDPIGTIKEVVTDEKNQYFKTSLFILGIWLVVVILKIIINQMSREYYSIGFWEVVKSLINPVLRILVFAIILHVFNKNNKKSLTESITATSIAYIPVVGTAILGLLTFVSVYVTSPLNALLTVIATVLRFFVVKEVLKQEDDKEALNSFIKVEAVYCIAKFALSFLKLTI